MIGSGFVRGDGRGAATIDVPHAGANERGNITKGYSMNYIEIHELVQSNHKGLINSGFAHAVNIKSLYSDEIIELQQGVQIRKASPEEISTFRAIIPSITPKSQLFPSRDPFETSVDVSRDVLTRQPPQRSTSRTRRASESCDVVEDGLGRERRNRGRSYFIEVLLCHCLIGGLGRRGILRNSLH
jgi:hypothetical protein